MVEILREIINFVIVPTLNLVALLTISKIGQDWFRKKFIGMTLEEEVMGLQNKLIATEVKYLTALEAQNMLKKTIEDLEKENDKLIRMIDES